MSAFGGKADLPRGDRRGTNLVLFLAPLDGWKIQIILAHYGFPVIPILALSWWELNIPTEVCSKSEKGGMEVALRHRESRLKNFCNKY